MLTMRVLQNFCLCLVSMVGAMHRCCNLLLKKDLVLATVESPRRRAPEWPVGLMHQNKLMNVIVETIRTMKTVLMLKINLMMMVLTAMSTSRTDMTSR